MLLSGRAFFKICYVPNATQIAELRKPWDFSVRHSATFFTRDSIYAIARICYRPSLRPSVRLSDGGS